MASRSDLTALLDFHKAARDAAQTAYIALLNGQVQSYTIGSRNLTKFDLTKLRTEIAYHQKEVDALTAELNGQKRRRAVGVIPRDW
jgi:uncharacterized protein YbaP (TraB family)